MNPKQAFFIWASYGIAAVVVAWNLFAPRLARKELRRALSDHEAGTEDEA